MTGTWSAPDDRSGCPKDVWVRERATRWLNPRGQIVVPVDELLDQQVRPIALHGQVMAGMPLQQVFGESRNERCTDQRPRAKTNRAAHAAAMTRAHLCGVVQPGYRQRLEALNFDIPTEDVAAFEKTIAVEVARWAELVKATGFKASE